MERKEVSNDAEELESPDSSTDDEQNLVRKESTYENYLRALTQDNSEKASTSVNKKEDSVDLISTLVDRSKELRHCGGPIDNPFDVDFRERAELKPVGKTEPPISVHKLASSFDSTEEFPKHGKKSDVFKGKFLERSYFARQKKSKVNKWEDFLEELQQRETGVVSPVTAENPMASTSDSSQHQQSGVYRDQQVQHSKVMYCSNCERIVLTVVKYEIGLFSYISAVLCVVLLPFLIICVCVPFFFTFFKDKKHFCPVCGDLLDTVARC